MVFQYAPIRADNHRRSQWISGTDSFCTAVQRGARQGVQKTLHRQRINAVWQAIKQQVQGGVEMGRGVCMAVARPLQARFCGAAVQADVGCTVCLRHAA